jgi:cell division septation protein DedD
MDIAARISELLFHYECVVLPEFGGFISNNKSAQINYITHQFKAPYREILFNVQLTSNDGLLIKHISEKEAISYIEAKQKITEFVSWCRQELESGRQLEFAQIGHLSFDSNRNIVFEQDHQVNYNPDSFGLTPLVSPAIKRVSQEDKIKGIILPHVGTGKRTNRKAERTPDEKTSKSKKAYYRFPLALMGLLVLVILVTSIFMQQQSPLISFAGLFPSSSTEQFAGPKQPVVQNIQIEKEVSAPDVEVATDAVDEQTGGMEMKENIADVLDVEEDVAESNSVFNTTEIPAEETVTEQPEAPAPTIDRSKPKIQPTGKQYYIIAGSFAKEKNAQKLIAQLIEKGFSAIVADTNKNGMYRVAYSGFSNKSEAKQQLLAIRQEENAEAWLLRK